MTDHVHDTGLPQWPFADAEDTACFSCRHVLEDGHAILRVTHDTDDGAWQFLCDQSHEFEEPKLICLGCMIVRDGRLAELADLPLGWCAERGNADSAWVRELNPWASEDG